MVSAGKALRPSNVRWIVLGVICLLYFIAYLDRVNISIAAPIISKELKLTPTELGVIFSAFSFSYAALQIPGGWLGDRIGPRLALTLMGAVWSLFTILTALPSKVITFALVRLGLGIAEGGAFPTATRAFTAWIPAHQRGLAQGLPHSASRLGGAVAPPIVVGLILAFGWRMCFVILGAASLLWAVLWLWIYRNKPGDHWLTNTAEVELLEQTASRKAEAGGPTPWGALIRRMWPVTLTDFCYGWSLWVFLTWMPSYLSDARHFNLKQLALFATLPLLAGVIGDTLGGITSDLIWKSGHPRLARSGQTAVGLLLSLIFVLPAAFVSSPITAVWLLSASFFCLELTNSPLWALSMDIGHNYAGVAGGMMNTGFGVAGIISPIVFGALIQVTGNWTYPFILSSALLLIGAAVTYIIDPTTPLEEGPPRAEMTQVPGQVATAL